MNGIVADYNIIGQLNTILGLLIRSEFASDWSELNLSLETVVSLGFPKEVDDRTLWDYCHEHGLLIVTANRNHDGPNSLEAAIRDSGDSALPVLTLADSERINHDTRYAEMVALDLIQYLLDIRERPESILGTHRLFLPIRPID
jgi:hypothetical protein